MPKETDKFDPVINLDAGLPKDDNGEESRNPVDLADLVGLIRTYGSVPTGVPKKFSEQIRLVVTGGSASIYFYDASNNYWRSINVTS